MKAFRIISGILLAAALSLALGGCAATDVVGKVAATSFKAVAAASAEASAERVAWVEEEGAWALRSPAGDELLFSADFSRNSGSGAMADMDRPDAELSFDAAPFLAAGLDIAKLPPAEGLKYELEEGRFMLHFELGSDLFAAAAKDSLEAAFAEILRTQRSRIGYHEKLDHYGIKLGNGNMFEWAKDLATNDKDIVFVLEPAPFVAAGMDPAAIEGWLFAKVETKDDAGKLVFVDKLLRPFDLK